MLPLGVIGYPPVGPGCSSPSPPESLFRWKSPKFRKSKSAANLLELNRQPREPAAATQGLGDSSERADQHSQTSSHLLAPFGSAEKPRSTSKQRPKHVPITIPRYVLPLAPDSPSYTIELSPATPSSATAHEYSPTISDFPYPDRKASVASSFDSVGSKPRHVEIKIPLWAQPIALPDSPISLRSESTSLGHSPLAPQRSPSPSTMARVTPGNSRTSTLDSTTSEPSFSDQYKANPNAYMGVNGSQTNLYRFNNQDPVPERDGQSRTSASGYQAGPSPAMQPTAGLSSTPSSNSGLSGLVCNVHRTTGREPRPLVGATTTILGDKLYVFGGRKLSRTRPQLTNDLYELDLIRRHWTKVETTGDKPPPRYFHSVCALGDTKLVCYGGMSPAVLPNGQPTVPNQPVNPQDPQPEVVVMSDVHFYDVPTRTWMKVPTSDSPQGRYAHCAAILPSSSVFSSAHAATSAIHHNPSSSQTPNQGTLGVSLDGSGGAEMVVVGGQDSANHYIEQISVFNLRSLRWTATSVLGRSCGAYRSVTSPLSASVASKIGSASRESDSRTENERSDIPPDGGSALLIYSNYNFLDVKLELQLRLPDGTLIEKPMLSDPSPPGLRFPNGGIIDNYFVVSGTFLTSSKQEYALWALDLRKLKWSRIDAGASTFSQGSWNRGVLWSRRNTFVILGNRRRSLVEDYNHRRINFANICMVELEAFGLYDNPRKRSPASAFASASSPARQPMPDPRAGGRQLSKAAEDLGQMAMGLTELSDMDFIDMDGNRVPANSHLVSRRWGPYFKQLLLEGMATADGNDTATLRPSLSSLPSRQSSLTITPSISSGYSSASTLINSTNNSDATSTLTAILESKNANPATRPRSLYLPHTALTIQALLHFLYTSSLPPPSSQLCTPQILCSLLQLARPYRVDGLLEAVVERLHAVLDNRNTAAIFNAAAMAAGGGDGVVFFNRGLADGGIGDLINGDRPHTLQGNGVPSLHGNGDSAAARAAQGLGPLRIDTDVNNRRPDTAMSASGASASEDEISSAGTGPTSEVASNASGLDIQPEIWTGELSSVVGLQKRGLRGLMEGRRMREQHREGVGSGDGRVGLGIA